MLLVANNDGANLLGVLLKIDVVEKRGAFRRLLILDRIRSVSEILDANFVKLIFESLAADQIDFFVLHIGALENVGDDRRRIYDALLVELLAVAELCELARVDGARFRCVVREYDDSLAERKQMIDERWRAGDRIFAEPQNALKNESF